MHEAVDTLCLSGKYRKTHRFEAGLNAMAKAKLFLTVGLIAGIIAVLVWQYAGDASLRDENDRLRQTLTGLKQIVDVSAPVTADDTLTEEQRAELLKLRDEATELRSRTNQIADLTEANQKLRTSLNEARAPRQAVVSQKKRPEDALPQDIHPKESWAYRGFSTPEATVESTLWAMVNGDKETAMKAFGPDMLPEMEKALQSKEMLDEMKKIMLEFRVLDRQQISPDEMVLTISTTQLDSNGSNFVNPSDDTVFKRINGEWKVTKEKPPSDN